MKELIASAKAFQETEDLTELLFLALSEERRQEWQSSIDEYRARMGALKAALATAESDSATTSPPDAPLPAPVAQTWPHKPKAG